VTTRRRTFKNEWPECLRWYSPKRYDRAASSPPIAWLSYLSERARAERATIEEAAGMVRRFQTSPLTVSTARIPVERPVWDVGFDDYVFMSSLMAHPAVAPEMEAWANGPPVGSRLLAAIFAGGRSPANDPTLHDLMLDEYDRNRDHDPVDFGLHRILVRLDMRLPDAVLKELFAGWLKDRRERMRLRGVKFGSARARGRQASGHIGPEQIRQWADLRVLDYLDVRLTCRLEGVPLPNAAELGRRLFASDAPLKGDRELADTTTRIRQYTAPEARRIVTRAFLDSFGSQVAAAATRSQKVPES